MPNHVTNRIVVSGPIEDVAAFKKLMVVEDKSSVVSSIALHGTDVGLFDTFDFNQIIPQPEILDYISNPIRYSPNGRVIMFDHKDAFTTDKGREATEVEQAEINAAFTGSRDPILTAMPGWYDWRVNNWGTKWNAYEYRPIEDHARFEFMIDTAWSAPNPVYDKLAERFPTLGFDLAWFDEGWMHAGSGSLGHCVTTGTSEDFYQEPNDDIYEKVYGVPPISDEEITEENILFGTSADDLRLADNFTNYDVGTSMDVNGCFPLTAVYYGDDTESLTDDELYNIRRMRSQIMDRLGIAT